MTEPMLKKSAIAVATGRVGCRACLVAVPETALPVFEGRRAMPV